MTNIITKLLEFFASLIPQRVYPWLLRRNNIDFFYHAVSSEFMEHARHLYPIVPVDDFEGALDYLQEHFQFVSYSQIHASRTGQDELPPRAIHLSFDDGFVECFSVVRPLLLDRSIPCTFFVATDWIDNQAMFYRNKVSLCIDHLRVHPEDISKLDGIAPKVASLDEVVPWLKELRLPDEIVIDDVCQRIGVDWQTFLDEKKPYLSTAQIQQMHAEGFTFGAHRRCAKIRSHF